MCVFRLLPNCHKPDYPHVPVKKHRHGSSRALNPPRLPPPVLTDSDFDLKPAYRFRLVCYLGTGQR